MTITYSGAHSPVWANAEHTRIDLIVQFDHIEGEVPFTAAIDDAGHGEEIFAAAAAGAFGEVAQYVAPTEAEIAARSNPRTRAAKMKLATTNVSHWDAMGEPATAEEWRVYYRALYALAAAPAWPQVPAWPTEPTTIM